MRLFRDNGYKTYFVTGGGQDFVRVYSEQTYGVPPEQVVGSAGATKFSYDKDGKPILTKEPKLLLDDDKAGKPEGIHLVIGRRPVAAFGNSVGDKEMLEYTQAGDGARLMMLVHHDDPEREYAYGPKSKVGTFTDALMDEAKSQRVERHQHEKRLEPDLCVRAAAADYQSPCSLAFGALRAGEHVADHLVQRPGERQQRDAGAEEVDPHQHAHCPVTGHRPIPPNKHAEEEGKDAASEQPQPPRQGHVAERSDDLPGTVGDKEDDKQQRQETEAEERMGDEKYGSEGGNDPKDQRHKPVQSTRSPETLERKTKARDKQDQADHHHNGFTGHQGRNDGNDTEYHQRDAEPCKSTGARNERGRHIT